MARSEFLIVVKKNAWKGWANTQRVWKPDRGNEVGRVLAFTLLLSKPPTVSGFDGEFSLQPPNSKSKTGKTHVLRKVWVISPRGLVKIK